MPQIQEYLPQQEAAGPVGGTSPNIELAGALGRSIERVGAAISEGTDVIHRRKAQEETADVYATFADQRAEWTDRLQKQTQDGSLNVDEFQKDFDQKVSSLGDELETPEGKNFFERQQARLKSHLTTVAAAGAAQMAANEAKGKWKMAMDSNSNALMKDPSSFQDVYEQGLESVDQLIKTGGLPEKLRDQAVNEMGAAFAKSAVRGYADLNPDKAKEALDQGMFDQFLTGDQKHQMYAEVNHLSHAAEVEDRRAAKTVEDARKKTAEAWGQEVLPKLVDNSLSTKEVMAKVQDGTLTWEQGQRWVKMIDAGAKHADNHQSDPAVKNDIIARITDTNNPNHISDMKDVMPYVTQGKLSISDFNKINGLFNKTPEGQALQQGEKNLFQMAKSTIRFKNPMTQQQDPLGEQKLSQFMQDYLEAKKNPGKDLSTKDLLDPNSPNYFGKKIQDYQTPLQEQLSHVAQDRSNKALGLRKSNDDPGGKPTDKNVRQPGESAADYLKRRGL